MDKKGEFGFPDFFQGLWQGPLWYFEVASLAHKIFQLFLEPVVEWLEKADHSFQESPRISSDFVLFVEVGAWLLEDFVAEVIVFLVASSKAVKVVFVEIIIVSPGWDRFVAWRLVVCWLMMRLQIAEFCLNSVLVLMCKLLRHCIRGYCRVRMLRPCHSCRAPWFWRCCLGVLIRWIRCPWLRCRGWGEKV